MQTDKSTATVRPIPLIRYLGLTVGCVVGLPSWIGWVWFLFNPSELVANTGGAAFAFVIGGIALFATWRWMRIGGSITPRLIRLSGWLRTVDVIPAELSRLERVSTYSSESGRDTTWYLMNERGETLGVVPTGVEICRDWDQFLNQLQRVARQNRNSSHTLGTLESSLTDRPVDDWTAKDIDRYEREH